MTGQRGRGASAEDVEAYLDELIVRRELARNLCWYNPHYDTIHCLRGISSGGSGCHPAAASTGSGAVWALQTLEAHMSDERPALYSYEQLAGGQTGDPYWNAAQMEMVSTGKMHNYMR